jgi:hypothetical protein
VAGSFPECAITIVASRRQSRRAAPGRCRPAKPPAAACRITATIMLGFGICTALAAIGG